MEGPKRSSRFTCSNYELTQSVAKTTIISQKCLRYLNTRITFCTSNIKVFMHVSNTSILLDLSPKSIVSLFIHRVDKVLQPFTANKLWYSEQFFSSITSSIFVQIRHRFNFVSSWRTGFSCWEISLLSQIKIAQN